MNGFDFTLYQLPTNKPDTPYIHLQVGKGKKKQSSLYMALEAFECISGVIWNKHREFENQKHINQINNDDWPRILSGLSEVVVKLNACTEPDQLIRVLSIRNHLDNQKHMIFEQKEQLQSFITELSQWIETHLKKEKYILIIRND